MAFYIGIKLVTELTVLFSSSLEKVLRLFGHAIIRSPTAKPVHAMPFDHYRFVGAPGGTEPKLLFDVKIDILDVRSGFRLTERSVFFGDYLDDPDLRWTADMVRPVAFDELEAIEDSPVEWPEHADELIMEYLSRRRTPTIWYHRQLKLYGKVSETKTEFEERCREELLDDRNKKMGDFEKLFFHRLSALERRAFDSLSDREWIDEGQKLLVLADVRKLFAEAREKASLVFVVDRGQPSSLIRTGWSVPSDRELEEKLNNLWCDLGQGCKEICGEFDSLATEIDSYEVSFAGQQVDIFSRGFVWV